MQLNFKIAFCAAWTLAVLTIPFAESRVIKGRREAYGAERATTVEKLLQKLYPGTTIQWDPHLAIRDASGKSKPVELGDLSSMRQSDGSMVSVTHLQVGTAKRDYIENAKQFRPVARPAFTTEIIAFRSDSSGNITDVKKSRLIRASLLRRYLGSMYRAGDRMVGPLSGLDTNPILFAIMNLSR